MLKVISPSEPLFKRAKYNSFKPLVTKLSKVIMPNKIKKINIPTTDLASLCGMDHYNNHNKSMCKIWKQLYPADYAQIEAVVRDRGDACSVDSNVKKLAALQKKSGTKLRVTDKVSAINQKRYSSSSTLNESQSAVASEIKDCTKLTEEQKKQMVTLMNSATNVVFGCRNEGRGIDAFTNITGKTIQAKQNKLVYTFHKDILETSRQHDYYDLVIKSHLLEVCKYAIAIPFMSSEDKLNLMSG
jgi:hypothetical protein